MKIEPVTCIWMFVYAINFELPEMAKKWSFGLFRPNLHQLGLFHPYKSSFRVISMIKMLILDQSKPISLYLKIKNSKIWNLYIVCLFFIKNKNKTSVQPILKLNSTSFMFVRCRVKKSYPLGGNGGTVQIASWQCNFGIYLDIQVYYLDIEAITALLCHLLVFYA